MKHKIFRIAIIFTTILLCWLSISLFLRLSSTKLIFHPQLSHRRDKITAAYTRINIGQNGEVINAILTNVSDKNHRSTKFKDRPIILYFHGNGGRVDDLINQLSSKYRVLAPAYPGYHNSPGQVSEKNMYKTADDALIYLHQIGFPNQEIIVLGHSLGAAPTLWLAKNNPDLNKVMIVGAFDSIKSVCQQRYKIFCVFAGGIFENSSLAKETKGRIYIFHNPHDQTISIIFGKKLFASAGSKNKKFIELDSGDHANFNALAVVDME